MANDSDACVPKALTDFIFDLYDSVTVSQISEEQSKLYETEFRELSTKYFANQPWPSPQSIASECNGNPLFLALYRELTHRHWHAVSRPTLRDRIEGWQVYRELFEEILEADDSNFFLLPSWTFDILNEFVYQFQGYCQIRTAVFASARKNGLLQADGTVSVSGNAASGQNANMVENLNILQSSQDVWEVEAVFGYLHRLIQLGLPKEGATIQPVYSYLSLFGSVALSRLECLLCDYTSSLQALAPIALYGFVVIPKEDGSTVEDVLNSVIGARLSVAYHAGVSYLMLRRYKDSLRTLGDICNFLQRGFKTGQLRKLPGSDQLNKQYERMLALLAILTHICPSQGLLEDSVLRAVREKHGPKIDTAPSLEEWFVVPKFISADPAYSVHRQQLQQFLREMEHQPDSRKLRSYLKLYTSLHVEKLAKFYDLSVEEFIPKLLAYKLRMRQLERSSDGEDTYVDGSWKMALDIHFYLVDDTVNIDEAEIQRRFENYFLMQIAQNNGILQDAVAIDTTL